MNRLFLLFSGVLLSASLWVKADEGMWLPILIDQNMATMTEMGLKLTADDIFNINKPSVKDAIVALDHGSCTAELVSAEGLLLTNHHCGYGEIQAHSTVEHDYLTNGFWAMNKDEELPNPDKSASILIRVEDVTDRIISSLSDDISEKERYDIIDSISTIIINEAIDSTIYDASVESIFKGNNYYLFVYETFHDIRLVGAPPESIGKYGSDTDNWMWPRHTGDFSIFRIYTAPDGEPAQYSEENIPFKPKHFLPVSLDGYDNGDFAFIMGYPGHTDRYMTSYALEYTMNYENPNRVKIRGLKQEIWKKDMDNDDEIRIKYSSKYARSANYWKYSLEQNKALKRLDVLGQKQQLEKDFTTWVKQNPDREKKYGQCLSLIEEGTKDLTPYNNAYQYLVETQLSGAESFLFAFRATGLMMALRTPDSTENINSAIEDFKVTASEFFKDYNAPTDKKVTVALIKLFMDNIDKQYYPDYINSVIIKKYKGNVDKFVDNLFKKSMFVDSVKLNAFLAKPSLKTLFKDPVFHSAQSIIQTLRTYNDQSEDAYYKTQKGMRLFVAGLMEMNPDKKFYPDANSTMRLTYGTVGDYYPADAVHYRYYTTLKGVMEKENPDVREFNVPAKLKELYNNKDYGQYADKDGTMHVCFTTNNDITGGNSGSPVMNAKGELIGLAFDGNSEAMSGDISFDNELQKCIVVDVRYVLFIIDKYAGATNLIDEMKLVKTEPEKIDASQEDTEPMPEPTESL